MHPAMWEPATFVAPMVPTLARKYRCLRIDMRGRGLSTAPRATRTLSGGPDESTLAERNKVPLDVMVRTARCMQVFDFTDWLPRVTCPTLLITADLEKSVPLEQQRYMEKAIANARLLVYEGVGRGIHLFHADQVARNVLDFLESQRCATMAARRR